MNFIFRLHVILLGCCFGLTLQAFAQDNSDEIVRVETSTVVVPVRVVDHDGKFIQNLKKENFSIFEDKNAQEIVSFADDDAPFTVALMIDVSDSAKFKLAEIQKAAALFVSRLRPQDNAVVFAFDKNLVSIYKGSGNDPEELQKSMQMLRPGGGTSVYDAVDTVIKQYLSKATDRKKAIVLFTDGIDTTSVDNYGESLRIAEESNALIYSIQYDTVSGAQNINQKNPFGAPTITIVTAKGEPLPTAYKRGTMYLNFLADKSGGKFYFADTPDNLEGIFSRIAAELGRQYSLSYYPSDKSANGKKHNIKVKINVPDAKVTTRKTYVSKSDIKNPD